jgi:hypothetical protein
MIRKPLLIRKGGNWHVMAQIGATATTDAVWVSLGGCPNQVIALRVWLALIVRGEH